MFALRSLARGARASTEAGSGMRAVTRAEEETVPLLTGTSRSVEREAAAATRDVIKPSFGTSIVREGGTLIKKTTVPVATGYVIVTGAQYAREKLDQLTKQAAALPYELNEGLHNIGKEVTGEFESALREMHKLEEGAANAIGMPVSQGLQLAVTILSIAGVSYVIYKIVR